MNKNKGTLIIIIIFLSIFSVLAIWGGVGVFLGVNKKDKELVNTDHEFKFNGYLYFYDGDTELGRYKCNTNSCDYAKLTIDDKKYSLNSVETSEVKTTLINKKYAFIDDGGIILYDVTKGKKAGDYFSVKNYSKPLANNLYIVQDSNNKWGLIKMGNIAMNVIECSYEFLGTNQALNDDGLLQADLFAAKDENGWKIINSNNIIQGKYFINEIYDFNDNYVITKSTDNLYFINTMSGDQLFSYNFTKADFVNRYISVITASNQFYLIDPLTLKEVSQRYFVSSSDDVKTEVTINGVEISIGGVLKETVAL